MKNDPNNTNNIKQSSTNINYNNNIINHNNNNNIGNLTPHPNSITNNMDNNLDLNELTKFLPVNIENDNLSI